MELCLDTSLISNYLSQQPVCLTLSTLPLTNILIFIWSFWLRHCAPLWMDIGYCTHADLHIQYSLPCTYASSLE